MTLLTTLVPVNDWDTTLIASLLFATASFTFLAYILGVRQGYKEATKDLESWRKKITNGAMRRLEIEKRLKTEEAEDWE